MQPLSNRTNTFTDSVIRRMTRISAQYNAVNLSQGFPDFDPPKELMDRLSHVTYEDFHHLGRPGLPGGAGREADPLYGPPRGPQQGDRRHLRQHRGDDGRHDDRDQPRR